MSQKILITGTNSGFGRLALLALARKGHTVFGTMRDINGRNKAVADELRGIASKEGLKLHVLEMELTSDESVNAGVKEVLSRAETLDVVVNNAGYSVMGIEETLTSAQLQEQLDVNVVAPHRVMRAVLPTLRTRGKGLIINVSSGLGRIVFPFMGAYCASKAALESLTESYRYELKPVGVDVTILQPGAYPTDFRSRVSAGKEVERAQGYGPLANGPQLMGQTFAQMLDGPGAQDPQDVVKAIIALIDAPAGTRPDRVVVDAEQNRQGVEYVNKAHAELQKGLLTAIGMGNLAG
jgi:NAD(P)-dependent dehydrogenase (short-subunit alcohol dehydrogenase family)